ncbi:hypothetical protein ANAPH2_00842 [Anaplasma phagocytophilum]|nr:hypothetical protein ANAPH2_00842 [Anaplasma phagocytophilum]
MQQVCVNSLRIDSYDKAYLIRIYAIFYKFNFIKNNSLILFHRNFLVFLIMPCHSQALMI